MSVHTRKKIMFGVAVAVDVMISCWLLYASLEMNEEEERGEKLLNNLILVPFFCIINLSMFCAVLYTYNIYSRKGGKCESKNT